MSRLLTAKGQQKKKTLIQKTVRLHIACIHEFSITRSRYSLHEYRFDGSNRWPDSSSASRMSEILWCRGCDLSNHAESAQPERGNEPAGPRYVVTL